MSVETLDINKELERLIYEYNVDRHYPAYRVSRRACNFVHQYVKELSKTDKVILFISMDENALNYIKDYVLKDNVRTLLINSLRNLEDRMDTLAKADEIYIVSFSRTVEILSWMYRHGFCAQSIYDLLEEKDIYCQMEFYRFFPPIKMSSELALDYENLPIKSDDGLSLVIYEYYYQKQRFLYSNTKEAKKLIAEKLFFLAICMRNFLEAERIFASMYEADDFKKFLDEVWKLCDKAREILNARQKRDIIVYWIDCLPYEAAQQLEYVQSRREHSINFSKAFTVTPYTNPTCKTMFCGKREVDDLGYKIARIDEDNSPLLADIRTQNCGFSILSGRLKGLFGANYRHCTGSTTQDSCAEVFWNLLSQMLCNTKRMVYLVHELVETHYPLLSVRRNRLEQCYIQADKEAGRKELNEQLRFYDTLLGEDSYRIYMSDHGETPDPRERAHILFQIYHSSYNKYETDKVFSLLDFHKVMSTLLRNEEIQESFCCREYAPVQNLDFYSISIIKQLNKVTNLPFYTAYKGIVTNEYIYLHFKTGDELLDRWEDGLSVPIWYWEHPEHNTEFFKDIRKKAGDFPKELDTDFKFQDSKYIYKMYENLKRSYTVIFKLINNKLAVYEDGSVALRMGGEHSWILYSILTEENRKKIGVIIDGDKICKCAKLGIEIICPGETNSKKIKAIVLSTFKYLKDLKEEAEERYKGLDVIDIYDYLKEFGFYFYASFWKGCYENEDERNWNVGLPELGVE